MSRTSHFLICVMVAGLAFMAGLRAYQAYEQRVVQEDETVSLGTTFQQVPVHQGPAPIVPGVLMPLSASGANKEIFLHEEPLTPQAEQQQARQTLTTIIDDYRQTPKMQAFYTDLRQATGRQDITMETLSGENLGALMQQYPQLQGVIAKHAQDPEFAAMLQEIFANPQFVRSVAVLQRPGAGR